MTAEMKRLPLFNDLKIGTLAENEGGRTQKKKRHPILFYPWTRVTAATWREGS